MELDSLMNIIDGNCKCSVLGDFVDMELLQAAVTAMETGSLIPLIKQELQCKIQCRRLSQGKPEMSVSFPDPPKDRLTPIEKERQATRKDKNRLAAQRSRHKKRQGFLATQKEIAGLLEQNELLKRRVAQLNEEKIRLSELLKHQIQVYQQNASLSVPLSESLSPFPRGVVPLVPWIS